MNEANQKKYAELAVAYGDARDAFLACDPEDEPKWEARIAELRRELNALVD